MRLRRLTLERYRGAAGVAVDFRADARLHMVVGSNEAGKSTLLNGISDALFGFKKGTLDFEIDYDTKDLLVGATLERDGEILAFTRRRGNKNTLLDIEGEVALPDAALEPFIRGLTRDEFERRFALDSDRLRQHARALIAGGDPAEALFEATSGLVKLAETMRALEIEAEDIFVSRGRTQRLAKLRAQHDDAAAAERDAALAVRDLEANQRAVDDARSVHDEARAILRALRTEYARADLLHRLHDVYLDRRAAELALEDHVDLNGVPTGAVEALAMLVDKAKGEHAALVRAEADLERAESVLSAIELDEAAAGRAEAIEELRDRAGEMRPYRESIPNREREIDALNATLDDLARRIGLADRATLEAHRPDEYALARIESALGDGRELTVEAKTLTAQAQEERELLAAHDEKPEPFDEREQTAAFAALEMDLSTVSRIEDARREHAERSETLRLRLAAAVPAVTDAALLERLPATAAVAKAVEAMTQAEAEARAAERRAEEARETLRDAGHAVQGEKSDDLPTVERIVTARRERDAALQRAAADAAQWSDAWRTVSAADALADLAHRDAHALATYEAARRARAAATERSAEADSTAGRAKALVESRREELAALFPVPIGDASGADMQTWRRDMKDAALEVAGLVELAREIARMEAKANALAAPLASIAGSLGGAPTGLGTGALARWIGTALAAARDARQAHAATAGERKGAASRVERRERELAAVQTALDEWNRSFAEETKASLGRAMSAAEAQKGLAIWREATTALHDRELQKQRADGMRANLAAFQKRLADETARLDMPVLTDGEAGLVALRERAEKAGLATARYRDAAAHRDRCSDAVELAQRGAEHADAACAEAAGELELEAIEPVLERLAERDGYRAEVKRYDDEMRRQLRGEPLAEHLEALDAYDLQDEQERIGTLAQEQETAELRERDAHQALVDAERALEKISADGLAEEHAFRRAGIATEMQEAAREWLVLRSAARMLRTAIARERAGMSDPRIERASALFNTFTGGEYVALEQDMRSGDEPRLVLRGRGGETKPVASLSEGSVDQLFLAIKLAVVEDQSRTRGPMPFIGDDVLQSSDPTRAAAIVREMAAMGEAMQPILFTHHTDIAIRAKQELGEGLDLIEL